MAEVTITAYREVYASSGTQTSWSAARDATSAQTFTEYSTATDQTAAIIIVYLSGRGGGSYGVNRTFLFFDLASINGTITRLDFNPYGVTNADANIMVAKSTAFGGAGDTSFVATDFDNWDPDSPTAYLDSPLGWYINSYNDIELNSTAVSDANTNGYLNIVVLENDYDYDNVSPVSDIVAPNGIRFKNSTYPVKLIVTYVPKIIGVSAANIIGVSATSISNVIGV